MINQVYSRFLFETIDYTFTRLDTDTDKSFLKLSRELDKKYIPLLVSKYGNNWSTLTFQYEKSQEPLVLERDDNKVTIYTSDKDTVNAFMLFLETLMQN